MSRCPNCGWKESDDFEPTTADEFNKRSQFTTMMDTVIKRVSDKHKEKYGYGVKEKNTTKSR